MNRIEKKKKLGSVKIVVLQNHTLVRRYLRNEVIKVRNKPTIPSDSLFFKLATTQKIREKDTPYLSKQILQLRTRELVIRDALKERHQAVLHRPGVAANNHTEALERGILLIGLNHLAERGEEGVRENVEMAREDVARGKPNAAQRYGGVLGDGVGDLGGADDG